MRAAGDLPIAQRTGSAEVTSDIVPEGKGSVVETKALDLAFIVSFILEIVLPLHFLLLS